MKTILSEESSKIIKNKKKLEGVLNVKITIKDEQFHGSKAQDKQVRLGAEEILIDGKPEDEYLAEKIICISHCIFFNSGFFDKGWDISGTLS